MIIYLCRDFELFINPCDVEDIVYDDYCILAVNYIDGIVLEVIGGCL